MSGRRWIVRLFILLLVCAAFSYYIASRISQNLNEQILTQIVLVAQALPADEIRTLNFTPDDVQLPAFHSLTKRTQESAKILGSTSVYLMRKQGDVIRFGPESLSAANPLASPPGTPYLRPPEPLRSVFATRQATTVGPYKDEYGAFVSAFAPIIDKESGALLGVVGADITAGTWYYYVTMRALLPSIVGVFFFMVTMLFWQLRQDHKQALRREAEIAEKERHLRLLIESSPNVISLFDADGRYLSVNRKGLETMGWSESEVLGQRHEEFWPEAIRPLATKAFALAMEGQWGEFTADYPRKDGSILTLTTSFSPILEAGKPILRVVGIATDFSEITRSQEKLKESEERYRAIVASSHSAICIVDEQARIIWVNEQMSHISGYTEEELLAAPDFSIFMQPDDLPFIIGNFKEFVAGHPYQHSYSFRFFRADGEPRIAEKHMDDYRDRYGRRYLIISIIDVTDHRRMAEQLQQALKMEAIGRLAGGVAHDFNNLLTGITGNVHLALMDQDPGEPLGQLLLEIQSAAESATALTGQLLSFSRKQMIEPRLLDLNELISGLNKLFARLLSANIELRFTASDTPATVKVDPAQMERILVNLVVNANDAMPRGGRLTIEVNRVELGAAFCELHAPLVPGAYVRLSVSDTGEGMDEEVQRHIFEPFFTTKPKGHGTGLGLATIYGTVKQAGGHIEVFSQIGRGTTFRIFLPSRDEAPEHFEHAAQKHEMERGTETVLIVEDEALVLTLARKILSRLGYTVLWAENGLKALDVAKNHKQPIHLLFTDVMMPTLNGQQLAERLAKQHPEAKVLYSSGYAENIIAQQGIIAAGLNFIAKPYTPQQLAQKVREVLEN